MQSGSGPSPAPAHQPPPGRSSPSSAASPSSSSSAVSAPNHLGLESMQQRQQQQRQLQLAHRKALLAQQQNHHQQQQLSKAETDQSHLPYQAGGTFGVSGAGFLANSAPNLSQSSKKYGNIPYQPSVLQLREENQSKGLGTGQQLQNPIHQAYLQFALQSAQQKSDGNFAMQQQVKTSMVSQSGRDQDMIMNKLKMQELMSQTANKSQMPMFKRTVEQFTNAEKQMEQGRTNHDQRNDLKPFPTDAHLASVNMIRPVQSLLPPSNVQNFANNQLEMVQMQAIQAWAKEHNIDLSVPANLNLIAQILPLMQSNGVPAGQKPTETSTMIHQSLPTSKQQAMQSPAGSESSAHGNSTSDLSVGQHMKRRQMLPLCSNSAGDTPSINNSILHMKQQQFAENSQVGQNETVIRLPTVRCSGAQDTHLANSSGSMNHTLEKSNYNSTSMVNKMQTQSFRPLQQANQPIPLLATPSNNITGAHNPTDTGSSQTPKQHFGFTKKQLHVLKAQILAFRRLKRGERSLPPEVLQAISDSASDYQPSHGPSQPENVNHDSAKTAITSNNEHRRIIESNSQTEQSTFATKRHTQMKEEPFYGEEKIAFASQMQVSVDLEKEPAHMGSIGKLEESSSNVKSEQESEKGSQNSSSKGDCHVVKEKVSPADGGSMVPGCVKMPAPTNTTESSRDGVLKKYHGPIFDFSSFTRRPDTLASTATNYSSNLTLAYDVKDLLYEEAKSVLTKNRTENLKKISWLLAFNLERKIIKPDLVVQLQIEEKKLKLFNLQARLRDEIEHQQEEIMAMSDRQYRKFVRQCEQQRVELARQVQQLQRASREKLLKSVFQWRKKLLESHWAIRDARTTRNRGIAKYHERMLREFSKREDEDRNKRMEALKNNDVDRYREMLLEQQTSIQGDAAQRYAVLSSFLTQTEEYLLRLGGKITDAKGNQEVEEAANAAASAARAQGLSSEEIRAAAACAGEEVMIRNRFSEMNAPKDSSVNKYYNLAHAVTERVTRQPSMLRAGTLRDYQLVGLQWMLSLYNNKLNGILADEMGLGKTVQVMALIAYLMEFKGNYGPHLIIVPNAVLVNWKSELLNWLPSISCIFYVGSKEERSKLFSQEVCAVKFNVLVTTYEFIMYDRSKLSKIDWKYIVIDEAQRMKDRESVLARDLDRYRCQRRLLLTGTPLQNDLKELWSLLNLLLPEVFDNCKAFHDWFSKPFQKDGPHNEEDEWLETEKKVIIIHRLHQILEPFMLRRRLEDVEGSLPRKIPIVVRCRMSAIQGAIYDWIKPTGTIRVDPEDEIRRVQKNPLYQVKTYKNLNNKCMELRKVCNHPLLNYPYLSNYSKDFIVRSCGKLWVLDRILIKLHRAGHRVLLFSTMTKLLDILEEYLQWRRLVYRRIDGSTCLEDRELAIVDFNSPDSECFIFLLSIRAAGRGLNLQTADTVVIYDPDPNPQNEEQAVARAHRIGQKREVKVIYMEAVVDKISSYLKEDELRSGIAGDSDDDLAGRDRYMGSIESLIRSNIQQYKLDMADEVINAGRFDQRTTHEERRMTLEMLLHDEERYQENVHDVPSMQEVNRMIARSEEEVVLFDQMDEDLDWTADMIKHSEVPKWLRVSSSELDAVTASLSKKPLKNILSGNVVTEPNALMCDPSSSKMERRRGRPRKNYQVYLELDDEYGEDSDIDSEERNASEEEVEVGGFNDEGFNDEEFIDDDVLRSHKIQVTQGMGHDKRGHVSSQTMVRRSTNTSSGSGRLSQPQTPVLSSQKFGSLSLLEARPGLPLKKMSEELEEGEIAVSGDSHLDLQQSGSQLHDHEDGEEDQQVLQPKIKRKRSIRIHPRYNVEKDDKQSDIAKIAARSSKLLKVGNEYDSPSRTGKLESFSDAGLGKHGTTNSLLKHKHNTPAKKISPMPISDRISYFSGTTEDGNGHSRESWNNKANNSGGSTHMGEKMSDITQRKCKNVISKLQMRIHKDGNQIVPIFYDWWRRKEKPTFAISAASGNVLDLQRIEQRVDNLEYSGVTDFIADVQTMLKSIVQHCNYTYEVKCEADKLQALFFNIMKIAFPDSDFRQARNAVTFSNPRKPATMPAGSSHKLITNKIKRHTLINKLEKSSPPPRTSPHMATPMDDESRTKLTSSKQPKDSRPVSGSWTEKALEPSQYPPHPGDLVICKKKRKERDKSSVKQRIGPASPLNPSRFGPLSPTSSGGMSSGPSSSINRNSTLSIPRNSNSSLQAKHTSSLPHREMQRPNDRNRVSCSIADIQWAKPVKRMRTDSGKRRPSQM
ncbi:ATP-dependent helicase BRM-like isoform X1 [Zingiber officinale]|uniref:ATP-dependent helicase BRM n=1 Tax=Zingiber officinale TaxID=94328 RepID=A0A8J5KKI5_ZINOF|nr:ATP-dependent helicase BRM-like isoform X1 [Zingiber officinale]KAG6483062.1 hypothetical protein ZIOFF_059702 [Zingiber officinale]